MPNPHLEAMAGVVLADKYRLVSVLGSGGGGYVYQAEQLGLRRSVAIKLLSEERIAADFERFRQEARAASSINHPNAIAVYDFGVTGEGLPYIVMEHLRGAPLTAAIGEQQLSIERIVNITAQILSALEEAHARRIVHRDLKADNIILETLRNGEDLVKVIDFGLASFCDHPVEETGIWGTPEYMAPEQIRGEPVGPAADLYAAGVILYEMLVGRTPFAAPDVDTVLRAHLTAPPTAPAELAGWCPKELSDLAMWALAKSPADRPDSAAAMRTALLGLGDGAGLGRRCPSCGEINGGRFRFCGQCGAPFESAPIAAPVEAGDRPTEAVRTPGVVRPVAPQHTMVGRDAELERLLAFYRGSARGTLVLVGPTGIGKTRLAMEAARAMAGQITTFFTSSDPSGLATSWYPVLSMLEAALDIDTTPEFGDLLAAAERCGLPDRDAPGLAELFGATNPLSPLEHAVRRREAIAAGSRALRSVDRRYPGAVYCFADIDRYDQPSRAMIFQLATLLDGSGVRMLITTSDPKLAPPDVDRLVLAPLSSRHSYELAAVLSGPDVALPSPEAVYEVSRGLPGAIEQLVAWVAKENLPDSAPEDLVDLISALVLRLPAAARRALQVVAICGTSMSRRLFTRLIGKVDASVHGGLADLAGSKLLTIGPDELVIPCDLIAEVVTECMPAGIRRELHAQILSAIDAGDLPAAACAIAHHAEHAGDLARAYRHAIEAGLDAARRFDDHSGVRWYGRAVAAARALIGAGDPEAAELLVAASVRLADALRYTGQLGLAAGTLDEAELAQAESAQLAAIARARGRIALAAGQLQGATRNLQRAIGLALRHGDLVFVGETYVDLATSIARLGDPAAAAAELAEGIDVITMGEGLAGASAADRLWYLGLRLAELYLAAGAASAAEQIALAAVRHAERSASAKGRGRLFALLADIAAAQGRVKESLAHRAVAIDELRHLGDRRSTAELLIENARASTTLGAQHAHDRIGETAAQATRIASELATEVGWGDGAALAAAVNGQRPPSP